MHLRDYAILVAVAVMLYGVAVFSGRPLSVHEARVPQLAREMARGQSDWLLPQSGGRPWLERPPLPHWFTALSMLAFNRTDELWVVRLPAAIAGLIVVLVGAWIATRWYGRSFGLIAGVVIATSYELYQYATLAEDDIYLGMLVVACMAMFVKAEWPRPDPNRVDPNGNRDRGRSWIAWFSAIVTPRRDWATLAFFLLLGLTNFAKGPLVGAVPVIATVTVHLLLKRDPRSIRRYAWLWGWLLFIGLSIAWPWWAVKHYPDVLDNWRFDYLGQSDGDAAHQWDEAWWYYLMVLPLALAPWTWATVIGLVDTARRAWQERGSPERFLWCWALTGLLILSLPARKHHHYLVPILLPWAILSALGVVAVGRRFAASGNSWGLNPGRIAGTVVGVFILCAAYVQIRIAGRDDATVAERRFLQEVEKYAPLDEPIFINSDIGSLGFFRLQFCSPHWPRLLHNLSFLRDQELTNPVVYVITRAKDEPELQRLGETQVVTAADTSRHEQSPGQRFTLFRVVLSPNLRRYALPPYIGVMQAMHRKTGPSCGPLLEGYVDTAKPN
jgi:4-amino-4-deoxy-L-arabinose transferase-like glycosyltransferase